MTNDEAAIKLGCPASEIDSTVEEAHGTIITMADGSSYVLVPEDTPDADGKSGLMYHDLPHGNYLGTFPVFASTASGHRPIPAESDEPPGTPDDDDDDDGTSATADDGAGGGGDGGTPTGIDDAAAPPVPVRGKPAKVS